MEYDDYEIIDGKKIIISSKSLRHNAIKGRLIVSIGKHLDETDSGYFFSNVYLRLNDKNIFIPDFVVITKKNEYIIDWRGDIYGAPDMVVEVLSKSTWRRDLTIKKDTYEANGVREYWIIDPYMKLISVYLLRDGKFEFDDEYILYDAAEFEKLTDAEKAEVKDEIPVKILDGLKIPLKFIFKWGYK